MYRGIDVRCKTSLDRSATVLCLDDGCSLALVCAELGFRDVRLAQESLLSQRLCADILGGTELGACVTMHSSPWADVPGPIAGGGDVALLAEPFFYNFQHDLPWKQYVHLWHQRHQLAARLGAARIATAVPSGFVVVATLARIHDLWRSHAPYRLVSNLIVSHHDKQRVQGARP